MSFFRYKNKLNKIQLKNEETISNFRAARAKKNNLKFLNSDLRTFSLQTDRKFHTILGISGFNNNFVAENRNFRAKNS